MITHPNYPPGALVHGWKVLEYVGTNPKGFHTIRTECPTCHTPMERAAAWCRASVQCKACANKVRGQNIANSYQKRKIRFVKRKCCTNRRCEICAGTNHRIDIVKRG